MGAGELEQLQWLGERVGTGGDHHGNAAAGGHADDRRGHADGEHLLAGVQEQSGATELVDAPGRFGDRPITVERIDPPRRATGMSIEPAASASASFAGPRW